MDTPSSSACSSNVNTACPSPSSSSAPPIQNFRQTCDNCARSKVRCTKEQPSCRRCNYQGAMCVYSPSQRTKKRRATSSSAPPEGAKILEDRIRHRLTGGESLQDKSRTPPPSPHYSESSAFGSTTTSASHAAMADVTSNCSSTDLFDFARSCHTGSGSLSLEDMMNWGFSSDMPTPPLAMASSNSSSSFEAALEHATTNMDSLHGLENILFHPDGTDNGDEMMECYSHELLPSILGLGMGASAGQGQGQGHHSAEPHPLYNSYPEYENHAHCNVESSGRSCTSVAFSTLASLDIPSAPCASQFRGRGLTTDDTPGSAQQEASWRRSLDIMLKCNQAAVENLQLLFECQCTATTNHALLATTIIAQTLSWYEAGLERNCPLFSGDDEMNDDGGELTLRNPRLQTTEDAGLSRTLSGPNDGSPSYSSGTSNGTSVYFPPIRIGGMELDAQHGERVVAQIILVELIKLGKVVEAFTSKFCDNATQMQGDGSEPPQQLQFTLKTFLQGRLKRLVMVAKERLEGGN
ncbi:hypothetical protein BCR34DRAFT_566780 [Clohesyomyces aquaticus]|uniref:Zn(2)-C6 fungal-type domain-containing protein n=1 Tax=Clohesyomyces aquaticus TaxID=1231657 RepID=A0A1Y1ZKF1_9PLEO|nr:hypothetical protein BCR34DRAFT_566780 [Clohesyomyces aquaticus]